MLASIAAAPAPAPAATTAAVRQKTLKTSIGCSGIGLHSGARVAMTLKPGQPDSGIVFHRTDIAGAGAVIPARWDSVGDTRLNTCVANGKGVVVRTIEHLMAALAGSGVDNAVIEINGPEVPVMDGSAAPFLFLIECAGVIEQPAARRHLEVRRPVVVKDGEKMATLTPSRGFGVTFEIDFDNAAIARQSFAVALRGGAFKTQISRARTFGFEHEVHQLRAAGLARGGSLDNAVVIGEGRVLNEEGLRYEDEFVRHKILDAVGDLYLAGGPLLGQFRGVRSGHALNNRLLAELFSDPANYGWVVIEPAMLEPVAQAPARRRAASA